MSAHENGPRANPGTTSTTGMSADETNEAQHTGILAALGVSS